MNCPSGVTIGSRDICTRSIFSPSPTGAVQPSPSRKLMQRRNDPGASGRPCVANSR